MNDKLEKLNKLLELTQNDTITPKQVEKFLGVVLEVIKKSKDNLEQLTKEQLATINISVAYIENYCSSMMDSMESKSKSTIEKLDKKLSDALDKKLSDATDLIKEVKKIKKDGLNGSPDTAEEIKIKLEGLKDDNRLDISAIKGTDIFSTKVNLDRAISILDQRTQFLINKQTNQSSDLGGYVPTSRTLTINGTSYDLSADRSWTISAGVSGSGTTNEIAYFTASTTIGSLTTATYPSLTELSCVKGVTSAIQTQLNSKGTFTLPALTSGSVLYSNGTTIAQDNANFFWDATNHRLSLGTLAASFVQDNTISVPAVQYNTGTASQSGTTVTGVGTTFTREMVGSNFVYANGTKSGKITAVGSTTSLTVSTSQTVASQAYTIYYPGLQVTNTGRVGIGVVSPLGKLHIATEEDDVDTLYLTAERTSNLGSGVNNPYLIRGVGTSNATVFSVDSHGFLGTGSGALNNWQTSNYATILGGRSLFQFTIDVAPTGVTAGTNFSRYYGTGGYSSFIRADDLLGSGNLQIYTEGGLIFKSEYSSPKYMVYYNGTLSINKSTTANSRLDVNGSVAFAYVAKTANYTLGLEDYTVDFTANNCDATLPTAASITGRVYVIKNTGTGVITLKTTSSQTIDGVASGVLTLVQWDSIQVQSNGSNWIIIG